METGLLKFHESIEEFIRYIQRKNHGNLGCVYAMHEKTSADCKSKFVVENPKLCGYYNCGSCTYKRKI